MSDAAVRGRSTRTPLVIAAVALVALALAGCGGDDASPVRAGLAPSDDAQLVLRMSVEGTFLPPERVFSQVPSVSVYSDGRVFTEAPQIAIYPPPAMPALQISEISSNEVAALVEAARTSGIFDVEDFGTPEVADGPDTVFVLVDGGEVHTARIYMLGDSDDELEPAQVEARRAALRLRERLGDLPPGEVLWEPERLAVLVLGAADDLDRGEEFGDHDLTGEPGGGEQEWPGPPLADFGEEGEGWPGRCGVLEGEDLEAVRDAAATANTLTLWVSGGDSYGVAFRPLLPDEDRCPTLRGWF